MKCARCNSEIKVGSMYCSKCGNEAQFVSEDRLLEEDYLNNLLKENIATPEQNTTANHKKVNQKNSNSKVKKDKPKKKRRAVFMVLLLLIIGIGVSVYFYVNYKNQHSFSYQYNKAITYMDDKEYQKAYTHITKAIELDDTSVKARIKLSELYMEQEQTQEAITALFEVLEISSDYEKAYDYLIEIYEADQDFKSIAALREYTSNDKILNKLSKYYSKPPSFELEEGKYYEVVSVEIKEDEGNTIFYTTDGSAPDEQGKVYKEPIELEEGITDVRAVTCNSLGVYSDEVSARYIIEFQKPNRPKVTPDRGNFSTQQSVTVEVPEGCKVYYTWNGSEPTEDSNEYIYPLKIPQGNNILSLILVNEYNLKSDVLRCNYVYVPE